MSESGNSTFSYVAYGLHIRSALPIPEFAPAQAEANADVHIRLGRLRRPSGAAKPYGCFHTTEEEVHLFWAAHGTYRVRRGREIVVDPSDDERCVPRLPLLGVAMGLLLHQRGLLTLHASAVAVDDGAIAFVGMKGAGKSTAAAALHTRGHPLVADDVVALTFNAARQPVAVPGFPGFKLWPEAVAALGDDPEELPRLHPLEEKRVYPATQGFARASLPLRGVYALADGSAPAVEVLPPQEAFVETMGHSYALRFLGSSGTTPAHLRQCTKLAGGVPIYRLRRPRALAALPELAHFVEAHAARSPSPIVP